MRKNRFRNEGLDCRMAWFIDCHQSRELHHLSGPYGFLFGFADLKIGDAVVARYHSRRVAVLNSLDHITDLNAITIGAMEFQRAGFLAGLSYLHCRAAARQIKIQSGALAKERISHMKALRQQPAPFGINRRPIEEIVLSGDVVNRSVRISHAAGEHALGSAEKELHEISIVDVEIEQSAS